MELHTYYYLANCDSSIIVGNKNYLKLNYEYKLKHHVKSVTDNISIIILKYVF